MQIITELHGQSLYDLFIKCKGKFTVSTSL